MITVARDVVYKFKIWASELLLRHALISLISKMTNH